MNGDHLKERVKQAGFTCAEIHPRLCLVEGKYKWLPTCGYWYMPDGTVGGNSCASLIRHLREGHDNER